MARDPAQRLINWFGCLMLAVFVASAALVCWTLHKLWQLAAALLAG